jgi:hypothetical protein
MKRNALKRLSSFLPKPGNRLGVQELESRDVPAAFFVDPSYAGGAPVNNFSGVAAANFGLATPTNTFAGLDQAIAAAAGSPGADTIFLANGNIIIPNVGGTEIVINDNLTFVGGGAANTTLLVGYQVDYVNFPYSSTVFETYAGSSLNLQDFTYNGTGVAANTAFYYDGATSTINGVNFIGYGTGWNGDILGLGYEGQAVWARGGANITITGGNFTNTQGRSGVYASSGGALSTLTVTGTTFVGSPSGSGRDSYGVEVAANAKATVTNSTFTQHVGDSGGQGSAGIIAYAAVGLSPEISVVRNTFTNNTVAVYAGDSTTPGDKTSALIAYNNITGSTKYSIQGNTVNNGQVVNARFNWFGSASGPTGGSGTFGIVNSSQFLTAPVGTPIAARNTFVTGANVSTGNPVNTYTVGSSTPSKSFTPANSAAEARVAYADLTGDGVLDVIVGSSTSDTVQVFNGSSGALINQFAGLQTPSKSTVTNFAGGVFVAAGDINADGQIDVVVSQGAFDPRVVVYNGTSVLTGSATPAKLRDFMDSFNRGSLSLGVTVATGDFNGDGFDDIATGVNTFGSSNVRVYDGRFLTTGAQAGITTGRTAPLNPTPNVDFFAYPGFATGVNVAAGDVNGDGRADLVTGTQRLGANVKVFTFAAGSLLAPQTTGTPTVAADFYAGADNSGVRVAARDLNNDGYADLLFTLGVGAPPVFRINGSSLTAAAPYVNTTKAAPPIATTLLTAAYTATSRGAWVA